MKATIDRIEGPMAVLITEGEQPVVFNMPASFIGEAREGEMVEITVTRDPVSTQAAKERVSSLIEKLKKKSDQV